MLLNWLQWSTGSPFVFYQKKVIWSCIQKLVCIRSSYIKLLRWKTYFSGYFEWLSQGFIFIPLNFPTSTCLYSLCMYIKKSKMFYYSFIFWYFSKGLMLHSVVLFHPLIFALCSFQGFLSDTYWACSSFIHRFVLQCLDKILMSSFCLIHTLFHNFRTLWTTFWQQFSRTLRRINFSIGINVKNS